MCFKFSSGGSYRSAATKENKEEKESAEKAAKKQRLLETEGKGFGQKLLSSDSANVRKIFGN